MPCDPHPDRVVELLQRAVLVVDVVLVERGEHPLHRLGDRVVVEELRSPSKSALNTGRVMRCWASMSIASVSVMPSLRLPRRPSRKASNSSRTPVFGSLSSAWMRVVWRVAMSATDLAQSVQYWREPTLATILA